MDIVACSGAGPLRREEPARDCKNQRAGRKGIPPPGGLSVSGLREKRPETGQTEPEPVETEPDAGYHAEREKAVSS